MRGALPASSGGSSAPIINATQTITATSTIAITANVASQVCPVTSGSAITLTSNPQLGSGSKGQVVTIENVGTNTITFADGNGLSLQGTLVLGATQFAIFVNLGGFWQLEDTNGSPVWTSATFQNGFGNLTGFQNCEFTKFRSEVSFRGFVTRSGAYTSATDLAILTLPLGYRPSALDQYAVDAAGMGTGIAVALKLGSNGILNFYATGTIPPNQFFSLVHVRFRV